MKITNNKFEKYFDELSKTNRDKKAKQQALIEKNSENYLKNYTKLVDKEKRKLDNTLGYDAVLKMIVIILFLAFVIWILKGTPLIDYFMQRIGLL
ncbi:MAG: hypothetical protein RR446_06375 [Lachnospiraceae bacterium]